MGYWRAQRSGAKPRPRTEHRLAALDRRACAYALPRVFSGVSRLRERGQVREMAYGGHSVGDLLEVVRRNFKPNSISYRRA